MNGQWMYLSFADPYQPKGKQFLGGVIVQAGCVTDAILESNRLGINPGGEVLAWIIPENGAFAKALDETHCNRLLNQAEIEALWGAVRVTPGTVASEIGAEYACECCNPVKRA